MEASHKKKLEMKLETGKNGVHEASINMILVTKPRGLKDSAPTSFDESLLYLLMNHLIMKVGINFILENLNSLVNNTSGPNMPMA